MRFDAETLINTISYRVESQNLINYKSVIVKLFCPILLGFGNMHVPGFMTVSKKGAINFCLSLKVP